MELAGTVAIVTGAGRGIGRATALALARRGVVVVLVARTQPEIESVAGEAEAAGSTALPVVADVGREDEVAGMVDRALQTYGRVDILVNNAGMSLPERPVVDTSLADWERILRVNLTGPFLCARAVLPVMMRQRSGKIVNVASIGGGWDSRASPPTARPRRGCSTSRPASRPR